MKDISIALVECNPKFADAWFRWRQQPAALQYMPLERSTIAELADRIAASSSDLRNRTATRYMWFVRANSELAGMVGLTSVSWSMGYGEITYIVDQGLQRLGIATAALAQMIQLIFAETDLYRLFAIVSDDHEASVSLLQKLGFHQEGRLRQHYVILGKRIDQLIFGLLRPEWHDRVIILTHLDKTQNAG